MTALALKAFLTLLVVMDPVGLAPVFLALAGSRSAAAQKRIARKAILVAGGILAAFGTGARGSWTISTSAWTPSAWRAGSCSS